MGWTLVEEWTMNNEDICVSMSIQWLERLIIKFGLTALKVMQVELTCLSLQKLWGINVPKKSLYEAHQFCGGINEQYANWPHLMKLWPKKKCSSLPQVLQFVRGDFQNKMLSRATCELHWSWIVWRLWCEYLSMIEVENMEWRQSLSYVAPWGNGVFSVWIKYYKKFKLALHLFIKECDMIFNSVWKIKIFSTHQTLKWQLFFLTGHFKLRKPKKKE